MEPFLIPSLACWIWAFRSTGILLSQSWKGASPTPPFCSVLRSLDRTIGNRLQVVVDGDVHVLHGAGDQRRLGLRRGFVPVDIGVDGRQVVFPGNQTSGRRWRITSLSPPGEWLMAWACRTFSPRSAQTLCARRKPFKISPGTAHQGKCVRLRSPCSPQHLRFWAGVW
jgi:hypothetical protein